MSATLTAEHPPQKRTSDSRARPGDTKRLRPLGLAIGLDDFGGDCPDEADNATCPHSSDSSGYNQPLYILETSECALCTVTNMLTLATPQRAFPTANTKMLL